MKRKPPSPSWSRSDPRNRVLDNKMWLPQKAPPAMTSERRALVIIRPASRARQVRDLARELREELMQVAGDADDFVPACGPGNDREAALRQPPSLREEPQQRLVGSPAFRGCRYRGLDRMSAFGRGGNGEQAIGLGPRR